MINCDDLATIVSSEITNEAKQDSETKQDSEIKQDDDET